MYRSKTFGKMLLSIFLICLCFLGIGIFIILYSKNAFSDQLHDTMDAKVRFWQEQLDQEISTLLVEQSSLLDDRDIVNLHMLWDSNSIYEQTEMIKSVSQRLLNVKVLHEIATSVKVYFPERSMVISADAPIYDEYEEDMYYDFEQISLQDNGSIYLTVYFPLKLRSDIFSAPPHYYIRASITPYDMQYVLADMLGEDEGILFLADGRGNVFSGSEKNSADTAEQYPVMEEVVQKINKDKESGILYASKDGFATGRKLKETNVWLIYCYPDAVVKEPLHFFSVLLGCLAFLTLVLLGIYAFYAGKVFARPLNRILKAMEGDGKNKDFLIEEKQKSKDELFFIYRRYNDMVIRTEKLIRENLESKYMVHVAQLKQLQYQIQPHFLYNSLFLIYRMAQLEENDSIAEYAEHLGKYYQYITRAGEELVLVKQEIDHIKNYLAIQEARFGNRISVFLEEIPEEIQEEKIIPLILQPLVENAFEHGIKDVVRGGEIYIGLSFQDGMFLFSVRDNGSGITEEEEKRIKKQMEDGQGRKDVKIHALSNTDMRLKLHYGAHSGITFYNRQEGGFCVTAKINLKEKREHIIC